MDSSDHSFALAEPVAETSHALPYSLGAIRDALQHAQAIIGCLAAALVDRRQKLLVDAVVSPGSFVQISDLEIAARGDALLVERKFMVVEQLAMQEAVEDILISLTTQYHMIRPIESNPDVLLYLILDRKRANLGLARLALINIGRGLARSPV
jgi:hypothetical protein